MPLGGWGWFRRTAALDARHSTPEAAVFAVARPRRMVRSASAVLLWVLAFYALAQLAVSAALDRWFPPPFETVWHIKSEQVRAKVAAAPDRPLVMMLGSSRTDAAFQARRLDGLPGPNGQPLLAYNLGVPAAGPMHEWLYLRELLDAGIRPRLLLVEFLPPLFNAPGQRVVSEEEWTSGAGLSLPQLVRLWPYLAHPRRKGYRWLEARLAPAYARRADLHRWLARLLLSAAPLDLVPLQDEWGSRVPLSFSPEQCRQRLGLTCNQFAPTLNCFRPGRGPCRALGDLLDCCRREGIPVALIVMPESSTFQSWYSHDGRDALRRLLVEVRQTYAVDVIDARRWLDDEDFSDGHHPLPVGADRFTTRLLPEIQRLLACPASRER